MSTRDDLAEARLALQERLANTADAGEKKKIQKDIDDINLAIAILIEDETKADSAAVQAATAELAEILKTARPSALESIRAKVANALSKINNA